MKKKRNAQINNTGMGFDILKVETHLVKKAVRFNV